MPFYGDRLFASDTWLMAGPEGRCAALALWWSAWKQSPAGSLPDQDRALAQLAGYGIVIKSWLAIKDEAMRGWIKCADGRLYHPVVCELAIEAMSRRTEHQEANENKHGRQKRWRERVKEAGEQLRERGITPPKGASLETLERLLSDTNVDALPSTVDVSRDAEEIGKTGQDRTKKDSHLRCEATAETQTGQPSDLSKRKNATKPKTRVGPEWQPDTAGLEYARERGVASDREISAFRNHHTAKGSLMADWAAAWRTWCDNAVRFGNAPGKAQSLLLAGVLNDDHGIGAWLARQTDAKMADCGEGRQALAVNGWDVGAVAEQVAESARLPDGWRGSWDELGAWLRDDIEVSSRPVLDAIARQARQIREAGKTIGSIKVFDTAVRGSQRAAA
jgi:hypothetical protein